MSGSTERSGSEPGSNSAIPLKLAAMSMKCRELDKRQHEMSGSPQRDAEKPADQNSRPAHKPN